MITLALRPLNQTGAGLPRYFLNLDLSHPLIAHKIITRDKLSLSFVTLHEFFTTYPTQSNPQSI